MSGFFIEEIYGIIDSLNQSVPRTEPGVPIVNRSGNMKNGNEIYNNKCSTCHGVDGKGALAVSLNQKDFLNRASDAFIIETIDEGRENTAMPAWPSFSRNELSDLLTFLRSWHNGPFFPPPFRLPEGNPDDGRISYHYNCSRCHGTNGEGEAGPAIINKSFLEAASDHYIYKTIAEGRNHTSMFGWSEDVYNAERLDINKIADIVSYMEIAAEAETDYIYPGSNPGNTDKGKELYSKHCHECHGDNGEGVIAPALNNQEFLSAASNGYILATITIGRTNTDMPDWGYDNNDEYILLTPQEREDITAYLRTWQRIEIKF